jgi:hypothetical protein
LKKEASGLRENIEGSPPSPFISLSRLQQLHKCDSLTFAEEVEDALEMNAEFAAGDSVAQVMNKYSKNGK